MAVLTCHCYRPNLPSQKLSGQATGTATCQLEAQLFTSPSMTAILGLKCLQYWGYKCLHARLPHLATAAWWSERVSSDQLLPLRVITNHNPHKPSHAQTAMQTTPPRFRDHHALSAAPLMMGHTDEHTRPRPLQAIALVPVAGLYAHSAVME